MIVDEDDISIMIEFEDISHGDNWSGSDWSITDEDELAKLVARVALGQSRYALKILQETGCQAYAPTDSALDGAIKLLSPGKKDPYHRDGWVFQVISWIAAHLQNPESLKSSPHMIHAHKGFDGLHVCLDESNEDVVSIIICEEKATEGPRGKITTQVWPEFSSLETGDRDNELVSEVTGLLAQSQHSDPERAVHEIMWKQKRAYRLSITIGDDSNSEAGRQAVFKGYESIVLGSDVVRRRAETFHRKNLRVWMERFSSKTILVAREMEAGNV